MLVLESSICAGQKTHPVIREMVFSVLLLIPSLTRLHVLVVQPWPYVAPAVFGAIRSPGSSFAAGLAQPGLPPGHGTLQGHCKTLFKESKTKASVERCC